MDLSMFKPKVIYETIGIANTTFAARMQFVSWLLYNLACREKQNNTRPKSIYLIQ